MTLEGLDTMAEDTGKGILKVPVDTSLRARIRAVAVRLGVNMGEVVEMMSSKSLEQLEKEVLGGQGNG